MQLSNILAYMTAQFPSHTYVVNTFHSQTPNNAIVILLGANGVSEKQVGRYSLQFLIRHENMGSADSIANALFSHFDYKTNYTIGTSRIVLSRGEQTIPLYTGQDESDRHIYSVNIELIVDK